MTKWWSSIFSFRFEYEAISSFFQLNFWNHIPEWERILPTNRENVNFFHPESFWVHWAQYPIWITSPECYLEHILQCNMLHCSQKNCIGMHYTDCWYLLLWPLQWFKTLLFMLFKINKNLLCEITGRLDLRYYQQSNLFSIY